MARSDQHRKVKILLANPEPSTHGPFRHFAAMRNLVASGQSGLCPDLPLAQSGRE
jgi:hypothetical protein